MLQASVTFMIARVHLLMAPQIPAAWSPVYSPALPTSCHYAHCLHAPPLQVGPSWSSVCSLTPIHPLPTQSWQGPPGPMKQEVVSRSKQRDQHQRYFFCLLPQLQSNFKMRGYLLSNSAGKENCHFIIGGVGTSFLIKKHPLQHIFGEHIQFCRYCPIISEKKKKTTKKLPIKL